jgi:hypothetical protein
MRIFRLVCGLGVALLVAPHTVSADTQVRITAQAASIFRQADSTSQVLFVARTDQHFHFVGNQGNWIEITTDQGLHGFVARSEAEVMGAPQAPPPPPPAPQATSSAAPSAAPSPPAEPGQPNVDHSPVQCMVAGKFPKLDAGFVPPDVARARVYFKAGGTSKFYYVDMKTEEGRYVGILPKPKKEIKTIDYYVSGLSKTSLEGRTQDYSPVVVEKEEQCGGKPKAAYVPQANVVVGGGVPAGFELAGLLTESGAAVTAGGVAASHTALLVAGGVVVAGGTAAIVAGTSGSSCTPSGYKFSITYGFTGAVKCSDTNKVQQNYTIENNTCKTMTVTGLSVSYAFNGQCTNSPSTVNLALQTTSIQSGKTAVIRAGAPAGTARTFCCPTPPCAPSTCAVQETFNLQTDAGNMTLVNNFSVTTANDCPNCSLPHADQATVLKSNSLVLKTKSTGGEPLACFEGESVQ